MRHAEHCSANLPGRVELNTVDSKLEMILRLWKLRVHASGRYISTTAKPTTQHQDDLKQTCPACLCSTGAHWHIKLKLFKGLGPAGRTGWPLMSGPLIGH